MKKMGEESNNKKEISSISGIQIIKLNDLYNIKGSLSYFIYDVITLYKVKLPREMGETC